MYGYDRAEEFDTFAPILLLLLDRTTMSVRAILDKFECFDPYTDVENLNQSKQHSCLELGLQIVISGERSNTFFLILIEQGV